ncbi:glycerol acyltransferase [Leptolyngbya sp. 'hensonii']|uniref:1-acyl-sn-glycerol-3-phosphate acyltransferase n=1 Tax=Leptolyngbya sp. 'hensonii' TaxID=1922337 RepID=UPI00094FC35F|nr:1-acyl-sn-glycerol-3-phosphate acyltransferase [Leptolyngbya sp. 'hensonii']OLP16815.1 glycerol acyltransferase [Leptolyngbya sp. 'hensonii']
MSYTINQVQPPLEFIPPAFNPAVHTVARSLLPFWMNFGAGISHVEADQVEILVDLYRQFQSGKTRFMLAFRHPSTDDPLCLASLLWQHVPQVARRQGVRLRQPVHAHFMYDRGIPLWAGSAAGWLYSRLGGTPIHRGKIDRAGLRSVRHIFANGKLPIAAAPEGATNGHNEIMSPLEPGIAQMGFWCAEDLHQAGRTEAVLIVPIWIQYRYVESPWQPVEKLLAQLEADTGLARMQPDNPPPELSVTTRKLMREASSADQPSIARLYARLYLLGEHLLTVMEQHYAQFYRGTATPIDPGNAPEGEGTDPREFTARLQALLNTALRVAEEYFEIQPKGSMIDRCRRLEQAGWDRIFREDIKHIEALSPLERGLADRIAEEANLRMWHMRLVESFVAVTGRYVLEKPTAERFAETTLLIWDMIARIKGESPFKRPRLGKQSAHITVGQPISVSDRWETYQSSRRAAKQAVSDLTQDLQTALEKMMG